MSTRNPTTIRLSAPLELRSGNDASKLPAMMNGVAYSGGLVRQYGCVIDLDTTDVTGKMPMLFEHMSSEIVGVIEDASIKSHQIRVSGKLFSDMAGSQAERIAMLSKRGAPYQLSVGLYGYSEEYVSLGQKAKVNGKDHAGPICVLRNGKVRECSIVTLGADPNTSAQLFAQPARNGKTAQPKPANLSATAIYAMRAEQARGEFTAHGGDVYARRRARATKD